MEIIEIKATPFFEFLKLKDTSMWEIFSQMINGETKKVVFLNDEGRVLFSYTLPSNLEDLEKDRKIFTKEYAEKLRNLN